MLQENTQLVPTKEEILKMLYSPLVVNCTPDMKSFIYTYRTWGTPTKKLFLEEYFRMYFRSTALITALNSAKKAEDLCDVELSTSQKWKLENTAESMLEIIIEEKDEEVQMLWIRLFLLRPQTRDIHAQNLKKLLGKKCPAADLVNDVIETGPYKPKTFWENVGDWFSS